MSPHLQWAPGRRSSTCDLWIFAKKKRALKRSESAPSSPSHLGRPLHSPRAQRRPAAATLLRLSENPPITYSPTAAGGLTSVDWDQRWRVAYTKPRQEKRLAHDLIERGVAYFLPMVQRETSSGGRRRRNLYALFPSYLFFAGNEDARLACLRTERTVQLIDPDENEGERLRQELRQLATVLEQSPADIDLYTALTPGRLVRVKAGPMQGIEGTVLEGGAKLRLQLNVSLLGVGALVEIHPDLVEAL